MKKIHLILLSTLLISLLSSCEKVNSDEETNTLPAVITYQLYDWTAGSYYTYQSFKLYPNSNGVYFDSVITQPTGFPVEVTYSFDFSRYAGSRYLIKKNNYSVLDSTQTPVIQFNADGRITALLDNYDLTTASGGGGEGFENYISYDNFSLSSPVISGMSIPGISPSILMNSLTFDVKSATADSMLIESGFTETPSPSNRPTKYTVLFDSRDNLTNLFALSGYGSSLDPQGSGNTFSFIRLLPLPKLNMKLAKAIYLTQSLGAQVSYQKMVDFSYELDTDGRVTQATILHYGFDGSPLPESNIRILISY